MDARADTLRRIASSRVLKIYGAAMFDRNALSCAVLLLTGAAPVFAQDARPSTAPEDVIQDPMPRSRAADTAQSGPAQAQASEPPARPAAPAGEKGVQAAPSLTFSINPAMLLLGGMGAEVEMAVSPAISLFAAPSLIFGNSVFASGTDVSTSGFGIDIGLRYFIWKKAPKGFWFGPYGGFSVVTASVGDIETNASGLGFGGMLGYSWIFGSSFYFSLGAGGGYRAVMLDAGSSNGAVAASGPAWALRLAVGFAK